MLESKLKFLLKSLLFLLPWQTIWIYKEGILNGVKWQYGTLGFYATEILLWLCAVLFLIWYLKKIKLRVTDYKGTLIPISHRDELRITKEKIFLASLLIFLLYALASKYWALDMLVAEQSSLRLMEATILFLLILVGPLNFRESTIYFIAGAAVQSLLGIWQFLTQTTFAYKWLGLASHPVFEAGTSIISNTDGRWLRAYGAFPHPNILGGYLVISLILTTLLFLKSDKQNLLRVTSYGLLITLQTTALFFTFSRSAWLAFGVFIISLTILKIKNKTNNRQFLSLISYLLSLTILLSILFFPLVQTRFSQNSNNEIISTSERISGVEEAWQIISAKPLLGVGAGNYTLAAYQLNPARPGWEYQPVHNVFLLIFAELGIIGAVLLLLTILSIISHLLSLNKNTAPYILCLISYVFLLTFDHYLFSTYAGLLISTVYLGILAKNDNPNLESSRFRFIGIEDPRFVQNKSG
ncbi:MAG: hypothetical protein A2469_03675 [Candidatus Magasanikbacteria bacterium RIFOXYC2_FULL_40_16]|uniref:O-antigen ligase-related domain-containing protein n=1 Tax=Candidatus Magasanikbacteria bacterium RIFOXYC2_FULL_40_16 TaxID=1798703 RepID=A0A1F6P2L0_9BACT|nr:MAG: hypothetical protein A2224_03415 [Candidatus Magasanikbacteria bacterium RIFOXYA2_FULL_40_20]OGH90320.1 MAG: hypothetical protein A2469_03675 [Candidatus Magasanikbacteria bacterium RIFOXYC2_FULL_40_16]